MNVLEKILEEIEDHAIEFESFGMCDDYVSIRWIKEIIWERKEPKKMTVEEMRQKLEELTGEKIEVTA